MSEPKVPRQYPNVQARLRLSRSSPGLPARQSDMEIWLKGSRFRVRDEAGRHVSEILGDQAEPRGLGVPARTMEQIMDVWSLAQDPGAAARGATELYGDTATGEGWVRRGGQEAWPTSADQLAPAAEQILAGDAAARLEPSGQAVVLGRSATEYHGFIAGEEQGTPFRSEVTLVVSPPYLLRRDVRNAQNADHSFVREVVALEEGAVADADLTPPSTPGRGC
jgi:hypothetical protein